MLQLGLTIGWILTIFLGVLGGIILWKILSGQIDITYIICDENGWASLSRFQFLVFTFVIALSLFYLIASQSPPAYPKIPTEILGLLGISGGSYVLSKGIQSSRDVSMTQEGNPPTEAAAPGESEVTSKTTATVTQKETLKTNEP
jgi:hypothetical protein